MNLNTCSPPPPEAFTFASSQFRGAGWAGHRWCVWSFRAGGPARQSFGSLLPSSLGDARWGGPLAHHA